MEEDKKLKHVCKFCSKSFPCGRSLGGHMRSHMTNNNNNKNSAETDHDKLTKKKLVSVNDVGNDHGNTETCLEAEAGGYILRDKPKKTWRLADEDHTSSVHDKVCKECGKGFPSWKALFGHMKCHSDKEKGGSISNNNSLEDQDSWTSANQKLVMDSQSDNETAAPSKGRRSKRTTRYIQGTANSSAFSLTNNHNIASSSLSEIEQEQEEVALSLMMLSRDVGHWAGLNSIAESSDNNSVFLEAKIEIKASICNGKEVWNKLKTGVSKTGVIRVNKSKNQVSVNESIKDERNSHESQLDGQFGAENSGVELSKNLVKQAQLGFNMLNSSKRKLQDHAYDPELKSGSVNKLTTDVVLDSEFCKDPHKRSKFECTTCNKIFHSYQALGGHRASHRKIKGCFASRIDSSDRNSVETENSPDPTADSKLVKSTGNETPIAHLAADSDDNKAEVLSYGVKKSKGHECPICLKVFPSGQALGGHKRSHLVSEAKENQTIVIQKPIPEIRDFLDLNLPAPVEEETSVHVEFKPWWVGSSHKHEALVGLISN
ncbi:hypothetical protein PTKIN_Ptkin05aG0177600 [Pterospermum kingtungense]